tara:strand:+ start:177 stop:413 length:237 start_codon:yes stop_codon:yes gene_type:complete
VNKFLRGKIPHYLGTIAFLLWIPYLFGPILNNVFGITGRRVESERQLEIERIDKLVVETINKKFPPTTGKVKKNGSDK